MKTVANAAYYFICTVYIAALFVAALTPALLIDSNRFFTATKLLLHYYYTNYKILLNYNEATTKLTVYFY